MGPPIFCCGLLFPPVVKDLNHSEHFILSEQESQAGPSPLDARMSISMDFCPSGATS